jgi:hypothetical protein
MTSCTKSGQGWVQSGKSIIFDILEGFSCAGENWRGEIKAMILRGVEKTGYNALILKPEF